MTEPMFRLQQLRKVYGGRTVLDVEQLDIARREILALVGPSGAGKTTLLRLLNFLERPDEGRLVFDGQALVGGASLAQRRRVTAVFQHPGLLRRSVSANIAYGARLRGRKPAGEELPQWLERLGLVELADQAAGKLSAGEAQRVALARALLIRPDVLLLDEPTANLDPYNIGLIERLVREEFDSSAMTIVWVTHDIFQARRVADRVGFLLGGRLLEVTPASQFFEQPQTSQAAAFLRGELVM